MAERRLYLDDGPGEARGVVTLGRQPERLLLERLGDAYPRLGARYRARVVKVERGAGLALLDLGEGAAAALRLKPDRPPPVEGQALEVEIAIEPQGAKTAVARVIGPSNGAPSLLSPPMALEHRLLALAPEARVMRGSEARAMADQAEDEALAVEHPLPGGGSLAIETTRALTAVDVDLGSGGGRDAKRAVRQINLAAIAELGRLLRLKALGGLVVIDLVGRGHDGQAMAHAAQSAFAPDQPGVIVGPITKFGTLELALPRRQRPVRDTLCDAEGRVSAATLALRLARAIEREGRAEPGGRILAHCPAEVAAALEPFLSPLTGTLGARFEVVIDASLGRQAVQVSVR
jgi:Ribonuclease G/E